MNGMRIVRVAGVAAALAAGACSKDQHVRQKFEHRDVTVKTPPEPPPAPSRCTIFSEPTPVGRVENSGLNEISGLSASQRRPGVLYVHNDSGDSARFFALDKKGSTLGEFALEGASFVDCEDMAVGSSGSKAFVYLADIGDNPARDGKGTPRKSVQIYRTAEPGVTLGQSFERRTISDWQKLDLVYPDRPHDAETLMFDALTQDLIVVTKEDAGKSSVFRVTSSSFGSETVTLEKIAELEFGSAALPGAVQATGGDISATGARIGIRTYTSIWLFSRLPGESIPQALGRLPSSLPAPIERQGEALGFSANSDCYFTASEGLEPDIFTACASCPPGNVLTY